MMTKNDWIRFQQSKKISLFTRFRLFIDDAILMIGLLFIVIGSVFTVFFLPPTYISGLFAALKLNENAIGTVTQTQATTYSRGEEGNQQTVFQVTYSYEYEGQTYEGTSYTITPPEIGRKLPISLQTSRPENSRLDGAHKTPFGPIALIVLLFPLIGLAFFFSRIVTHVRIQRLLSKGIVTFGASVQSRPTNTTINDQPVMEFRSSFTDQNGQPFSAITRTHRIEHLEKLDTVPILYDPSNPKRSYILPVLADFTLSPNGKLHVAFHAKITSLIVLAVVIGLLLVFFYVYVF